MKTKDTTAMISGLSKALFLQKYSILRTVILGWAMGFGHVTWPESGDMSAKLASATDPIIILNIADLHVTTSESVEGEHRLKVEAASVDGAAASEEIVFLVNHLGQYIPSPAMVSDARPAGGKAPGGMTSAENKGPNKGPKEPKGKKQSVALDQLPEAVRARAEKQAGKAEFLKLEKESKGGIEIYTLKWGPKESERELRLAADGTAVESKEVVKLDDLPAPVRAAFGKAHPNITKAECKKLTAFADGKPMVTYEIRGDAAGDKLPVVKVSADGTLSPVGRGPKPKP